jgi:cell shape-determining protein MreD
MRWIPFIVVCYVVILIQTSLGRILTLPSPVGVIGPDFAAILAVFVALRVRSAVDCMLAAWVLGLLIDLTTGGGPGAATVVGRCPLRTPWWPGLYSGFERRFSETGP